MVPYRRRRSSSLVAGLLVVVLGAGCLLLERSTPAAPNKVVLGSLPLGSHPPPSPFLFAAGWVQAAAVGPRSALSGVGSGGRGVRSGPPTPPPAVCRAPLCPSPATTSHITGAPLSAPPPLSAYPCSRRPTHCSFPSSPAALAPPSPVIPPSMSPAHSLPIRSVLPKVRLGWRPRLHRVPPSPTVFTARRLHLRPTASKPAFFPCRLCREGFPTSYSAANGAHPTHASAATTKHFCRWVMQFNRSFFCCGCNLRRFLLCPSHSECDAAMCLPVHLQFAGCLMCHVRLVMMHVSLMSMVSLRTQVLMDFSRNGSVRACLASSALSTSPVAAHLMRPGDFQINQQSPMMFFTFGRRLQPRATSKRDPLDDALGVSSSLVNLLVPCKLLFFLVVLLTHSGMPESRGITAPVSVSLMFVLSLL